MKILSIIIPSYNTSQFIDKCIPTYISDAVKQSLEVLIVNDGSKDDTLQKAQYYEQKYPECIRVISKENGGHGSAVNAGIEHATGKYIRVIDGDDWVETENLVKLVDLLKNSTSDVVLTPYYEVDQSRNFQKKLIPVNLDTGFHYFKDIALQFDSFAIHSTTVKAEILKGLPQKFSEKCFYDDFEFYMFIVPYVETLTVSDYVVYDYLVGQKNQSVSKASALKNHLMPRKILKDSIKYFNSCRTDNIHKDFMEKNLITFGRSTYNIYLRNYDSHEAYQLIKEYDTYLKNDYFWLRGKILDQNRYLKVALKNKILFNLIGLVFALYKKTEFR